MVRHDASHRAGLGRRAVSRSALVLALVVLIGATVGLGVWWWTLRSAVDPIDANPVRASAVVTASAPCDGREITTVRLSDLSGAPTATLDGCGFTAGENLAVEYLAGHPDRVRLAGTSTAGRDSVAAKVLPIAVLCAGLGSIVLVGLLLVRRRRPAGSDADRSVTVAELRARVAATRAERPPVESQPPAWAEQPPAESQPPVESHSPAESQP